MPSCGEGHCRGYDQRGHPIHDGILPRSCKLVGKFPAKFPIRGERLIVSIFLLLVCVNIYLAMVYLTLERMHFTEGRPMSDPSGTWLLMAILWPLVMPFLVLSLLLAYPLGEVEEEAEEELEAPTESKIF